MSSITDQQLKVLIAKLLPERVHMHLGNEMLCWLTNPHNRVNDNIQVQDNQLLSLCREVEETLKGTREDEYSELSTYQENLCIVCGDGKDMLCVYDIDLIRASWQQRVKALYPIFEARIQDAAEVRGFCEG